jgi:hypothetical protein
MDVKVAAHVTRVEGGYEQDIKRARIEYEKQGGTD